MFWRSKKTPAFSGWMMCEGLCFVQECGEGSRLGDISHVFLERNEIQELHHLLMIFAVKKW